jgi:hypothetical protein
MKPLLHDHGHELYTPTYTGIGERVHLADPNIGLETHISDILGVLEFEDLQEIFLIGHSYGGMVATGVADRMPDRVAHLIYLDAFVPCDGQSLSDLQPAEIRAKMKEGVRENGDGWRVPPNPLPSDTSEADAEWITPRRVMQPLKTFEEPIRLSGAGERIPKTYINCIKPSPGNMFQQFAQRARTEPGWHYMEIDSSHSPHITLPEVLASLLDKVASGR